MSWRLYRPHRVRHIVALVLVLLLGAAVLASTLRPRSPLMCAFHGERVVHDLRRHHPLWSTMELWEAAHSCRRAR